VDLAGSEKVSNHFSGGGADFQSIYGSQASSFVSPKGSLTRKSGGMQDYSTGNGSSASMRVKEGQHINKSLFFLTQVIALKAEGKKGASDAHIPYRNSPLTKILRSSLGGNSRTAIVLCITPSASQLEQTFSTLRFGQNAKMIKNTIVANVKAGGSDQELRVILSEYERRLREMESDKNESSEKLRQIIENLMKEKDELA
jgi:centromeric protein E